MSERDNFIAHRGEFVRRLSKHARKCAKCKNAGLHVEMMCGRGKRMAGVICNMNECLKSAQ